MVEAEGRGGEGRGEGEEEEGTWNDEVVMGEVHRDVSLAWPPLK